MKFTYYDEPLKPQKGVGGKRRKILQDFLDSGRIRCDLSEFDKNDNAQKVYGSLTQAAAREPFRGKISVVKRGEIVSLNRKA